MRREGTKVTAEEVHVGVIVSDYAGSLSAMVKVSLLPAMILVFPVTDISKSL